MAVYYGNEFTNAYVSKPSVKIGPGDVNGEVKHAYFSFTVPGVAPLTNDTFKLAKIPKGAKVLDVIINTPVLTSGVISLGWSVSADAVEAAVSSGFIASLSTAAAALTRVTAATATGLVKEFASEVDFEMLLNTTWSSTSGSVRGYILYVVE